MGTLPVQPTPPGQQPPWNPHWYGNVAQWVAPAVALVIGIISVSLIVHYRNVDSSARSSDEHVNTLIDAKLNPATEKINDHLDKIIAPLLSQLTDLTTRVAKLEGRFEQLDTDQKRSIKLQLNKLSAQITAAQQHKTIIDSETVSRLSENVLAFANYGEPQISSTAWRAETQLANYRTTLNQAAAAPIIKKARATGPTPHLHVAINARVLSTEGGVFVGFSYDDRKSVPFSEAARYEKLNAPSEPQPTGRPPGSVEAPGPEFLVIEARNVELILDGQRLKNIVIHDVQVRYDGGPLEMENVYFVNCRFIIPRKTTVEGFAQDVITAVPVTFKASQPG